MGIAFNRFYRLRPLASALLCLPGILFCFWYAWVSYSSFDRYRRMADEDVEFTLEAFHLQLFDSLRRDLRRMSMPSPPSPSRIKSFSFHVSTENLEKLYKGAELDVGRPYVKAGLELDGMIQEIELRLKGQRHWHNIGRQKSLKARLPKGALVDGHRVFNLINDPAPIVVGEQIILELARENGVLTPESSFARVLINNADLGVFRYETQPDESLLRSNRMVPGSIYSGNLPGSARTSELWKDVSRWQKGAWRNDEEKDKFDNLEKLLDNIRSMSVREFARFAQTEMDLEAFATFDALDVAFGGDQHDFREDHKLHFDPYRGRWGPVAWNFRGFRHDPMFNLVENPVLLRMKMIPGYLSLRNRILYDLLADECSVSSVRARGRKILKKLSPELAADRFFDAYKLLPRVDQYHRQMVRPMDLRRSVLVFESEMTTYRRRHAFLMREIKKNPMWIRVNAWQIEEGEETEASFDLIVDGRVGVRLSGFRASFAPTCRNTGWQVYWRGSPVTEPSARDYATLVRPMEIFNAVGLVERDDASSKRGKIRTVNVPAVHRFVLKSACVPKSIEADGIHLAMGSRIRSRPARDEVLRKIPKKVLGVDEVPKFVAGETSPVQEELLSPVHETVRLGPGTVEVPATLVFGEHQTVEVAPGTRFNMGEDASLIFLGRAIFKGSKTEPIVIGGTGGKSWGGIALQGPDTAGSSLTHVIARGGTVPRYRMIPYPGMINIHDTKDIAIAHCRFGENTLSDDVVHTAYVKNLRIDQTEVADAFSDAFDLEFTSSSLTNLSIKRAGDDGLDLMGAKTSISDSVFVNCSGNGISAGEESKVRVLDTLVAGSRVGVLAKNASEVTLMASLRYQNKTGVRVYSKTNRYAGNSRIASDVIFIVGSEEAVKADKDSQGALQIGRVQRRLPADGTLDHLAKNVIGLAGWEDLDRFIETETNGGRR